MAEATENEITTIGEETEADEDDDDEDEEDEEEEKVDEEAEDLPDGICTLALKPETLSMLQLEPSVDINVEKPTKMMARATLLELVEKVADSEFRPYGEQIATAEEEMLMMFYDPEARLGEQFVLCTTDEAKDWIVEQLSLESEGHPNAFRHKPRSKAKLDEKAEGAGEEEMEEEEEEEVGEYIEQVSKEWLSYGSEQEVEDEWMLEMRERLRLVFQMEHKFFEEPRPATFTVRRIEDSRSGYVECAAYDDASFNLKRLELCAGVQCKAITEEAASQTERMPPRNVWTQTKPREMAGGDAEKIMQSEELRQSIEAAAPRLELVLQQNQLYDLFLNDWEILGQPTWSYHGKLSNTIREYQTYSDLKYSKDKTVISVEWHPTITGIIAVACGDRYTFDSRVDRLSKLLMRSSTVLIWSFKDPLHPQLILEAADDIRVVKFNPSLPSVVVGGCANGQLVLWDMKEHMERLRTQKTQNAPMPTNQQELKFKEDPPLVPIVRPSAVSSIDHSHKSSVEDIHWVPPHFEIAKQGVTTPRTNALCTQVISCGLDCMMYIWDIRPSKQPPPDAKVKGREREPQLGVPLTFQYLDQAWRPLFGLDLPSPDRSFRLMPVKFAIQEPYPDYMRVEEIYEPQTSRTSMSPRSSAEEFKVSCKFFAGSMDNGVGLFDWIQERDSEGKSVTHPAEFCTNVHGGPVKSVEVSPFFRDLVLTVGMWRFAIWKEQLGGVPLMEETSVQHRRINDGKWSPTRPSVFFIAKENGVVDVWDLHDRSHEPTATHSVAATSLTAIALHPHPQHGKEYMLAAADHHGTLHLVILPQFLYKPLPHEYEDMAAYIESEVLCHQHQLGRIEEFVKEKKLREKEEEEKATAAKIAKAAPEPEPKSETKKLEEQQKQIYSDYMKLEQECLIQLGMVPKPKITAEAKS